MLISYFVEVENQIQFAHVVEIFVENFDKVVDRFQINKIVVAHVHTYAEVKACIAAVDYLEVAELHNQFMTFGLFDIRQQTSTKLVCLASLTVTTACTSSMSFCFSSSSKFMYHLASLVLPALFWIRINRI